MEGLTIATKGIIFPKRDIISPVYSVTSLYHPLKVNIESKKPTIIIRPIKQKINITAKCYKE